VLAQQADLKFWIWNFGFGILKFGCSILDILILDVDSWILDLFKFGFWILVSFGFCILNRGFVDFVSWIFVDL